MLHFAAIICLLVGMVHSVLGERYILMRLFRTGHISHLFGDDSFTKGTIRFVWHITTLAFWGFAALLWQIGSESANLSEIVLYTVATVFGLSGVLAFILLKVNT